MKAPCRLFFFILYVIHLVYKKGTLYTMSERRRHGNGNAVDSGRVYRAGHFIDWIDRAHQSNKTKEIGKK